MPSHFACTNEWAACELYQYHFGWKEQQKNARERDRGNGWTIKTFWEREKEIE